MNLVVLSGRIHDDLIELDLTEDGTPRLRFSVGHSRAIRTEDGLEERTDWHQVVAFGDLAEELGSLGHGSEVLVRGHLEVEVYRDSRTCLAYSIVIAESTEVLVARKSR